MQNILLYLYISNRCPRGVESVIIDKSGITVQYIRSRLVLPPQDEVKAVTMIVVTLSGFHCSLLISRSAARAIASAELVSSRRAFAESAYFPLVLREHYELETEKLFCGIEHIKILRECRSTSMNRRYLQYSLDYFFSIQKPSKYL